MITLPCIIFYAPFEEEEYIVLLMLVCPSVDDMVSADYLENYLSQGFHISHSVGHN
jgi:hypothetical protein